MRNTNGKFASRQKCLSEFINRTRNSIYPQPNPKYQEPRASGSNNFSAGSFQNFCPEASQVYRLSHSNIEKSLITQNYKASSAFSSLRLRYDAIRSIKHKTLRSPPKNAGSSSCTFTLGICILSCSCTAYPFSGTLKFH